MATPKHPMETLLSKHRGRNKGNTHNGESGFPPTQRCSGHPCRHPARGGWLCFPHWLGGHSPGRAEDTAAPLCLPGSCGPTEPAKCEDPRKDAQVRAKHGDYSEYKSVQRACLPFHIEQHLDVIICAACVCFQSLTKD